MKFVVLGDLHYSRYDNSQACSWREEFYDRLFSSVAQQQADVVLALGDTTNNGWPDEFEGVHRCAQRHGLTFITVNGNHDLLEMTRDAISVYTRNSRSYFASYFNPLSGVAQTDDAETGHFVVLDTPRERDPKNHSGWVGPEQLDWLERQVLQSDDAPLFVFGHHPLSYTTLWSSFPMLSIENSAQVRRILARKREGAGFYFCGHNHSHSIARRNNWHFIQTAASLRSGDFRVIEFTPEQVVLRTVEIEGGRATYLLGQKLVGALRDFHRLPARGFARDRQLEVRLALKPPLLVASSC
jgi:3',5'-cyclic-AMP phosphodiesterase